MFASWLQIRAETWWPVWRTRVTVGAVTEQMLTEAGADWQLSYQFDTGDSRSGRKLDGVKTKPVTRPHSASPPPPWSQSLHCKVINSPARVSCQSTEYHQQCEDCLSAVGGVCFIHLHKSIKLQILDIVVAAVEQSSSKLL